MFFPSLLKVEVSADQIMNGDTLWVTTWWQNKGDAPSDRPLLGFLEAELGHQWVPETRERFYRTYWEPFPGTHTWQPGEVWKTTCRWNFQPAWNGTFQLSVGFCDEQRQPLKFLGPGGVPTTLAYLGDVEVGWGWGRPLMEKVAKTWGREFNPVEEARRPARPETVEPIQIGAAMHVALHPTLPALLEIGDAQVHFPFPASAPEVVLRDRRNDALLYGHELAVTYLCTSATGQARYTAEICREGQPIAGFTLRFGAAGRQLTLSLESPWDGDPYELLEIRLPSLISASGDDVFMVEFQDGGRLIPLTQAVPIAYAHHYDQRNAAALYNSRGLLALEGECVDDQMCVAVSDDTHEKRAHLGLRLVNKVRARGEVASIPVESEHPITINLLGAEWGQPSWQAAARFWRQGLQGKCRDLYRRAIFYKCLATHGPKLPDDYVLREDAPYPIKRLTYTMTFQECLEVVKRYARYFDGAPQVMYIAGFQKGGFDSNYPYVFETDARLGTPEELRNVIQEAKHYNAIVGIHDNYGGCLPGEYFDPEIIQQDEWGRLWQGWIWAGGMHYNIAPYKYARTGKMQARVKKTVELFGLGGSSHQDGPDPVGYDYDPACPASAQKTYQGIYEIHAEYDQYGIDATREALFHPLVGHAGHVLWARDDRYERFFLNDRYILLTTMVYHGVIGWTGASNTREDLLWGLLRGCLHTDEERHCSPETLRTHYLQTLPVGMLYDKVVQDVIEDGDKITVRYDEQTWVKANLAVQTYAVMVDGQVIAKDFSTFVPGFRPGSYLAYATAGGHFSYPAPDDWQDGLALDAVTLTLDGEGDRIECAIRNGTVEMDIPAQTPVRITPIEAPK